jgi:hypothetical protein
MNLSLLVDTQNKNKTQHLLHQEIQMHWPQLMKELSILNCNEEEEILLKSLSRGLRELEYRNLFFVRKGLEANRHDSTVITPWTS